MKWFGLFVVFFAVNFSAFAKDVAIVMGYDCNPNWEFGAGSENAISVLQNFGWDVRYYCGVNEIEEFKESPLRIGPLNKSNIESAFSISDIQDGDNLLVFINTHGELDDNGAQKLRLSPIMDLSEVDREYPTQDFMAQISRIEKVNQQGMIILLNASCFGGSCVQYIPKNQNTCVLTSAPSNFYGPTVNFFSIAFYTLPNSRKLLQLELSQETIEAFAPGIEIKLKGFKDANEHLQYVDSKIQYPSYKLKDIFSSSLWFDEYVSASYTYGFDLSALNVWDLNLFIKKYRRFLKSYDDKTQKMISGWIDVYQKKQNFREYELELLRNQMMSIALSKSSSPCAEFNLDRR